MTDQELTRVIAEKVMGWRPHPSMVLMGGVPVFKQPEADMEPFCPLTSDADCMAAWDKAHLLFKGTAIVECLGGDTTAVLHDEGHCVVGHSQHPDRRRAMCECMAKATETTND